MAGHSFKAIERQRRSKASAKECGECDRYCVGGQDEPQVAINECHIANRPSGWVLVNATSNRIPTRPTSGARITEPSGPAEKMVIERSIFLR
jgi:hypothetical protein